MAHVIIICGIYLYRKCIHCLERQAGVAGVEGGGQGAAVERLLMSTGFLFGVMNIF